MRPEGQRFPRTPTVHDRLVARPAHQGHGLDKELRISALALGFDGHGDGTLRTNY